MKDVQRFLLHRDSYLFGFSLKYRLVRSFWYSPNNLPDWKSCTSLHTVPHWKKHPQTPRHLEYRFHLNISNFFCTIIWVSHNWYSIISRKFWNFSYLNDLLHNSDSELCSGILKILYSFYKESVCLHLQRYFLFLVYPKTPLKEKYERKIINIIFVWTLYLLMCGPSPIVPGAFSNIFSQTVLDELFLTIYWSKTGFTLCFNFMNY